MNTILLTPEQVMLHWPTLLPRLQKAIDHGVGESTMVDYLSRALTKAVQVWVFCNDNGDMVGCGMTQFLQYSTHKTLHIIACEGIEWSTWAEEYYKVEQFAKENGAKAVEQWGRPGWSKLLPKVIPGFQVAIS